MLMLKLQCFGHPMQRVDSLEKTLILGKIEGRRRRGNRAWDGWMASSTQWTWVWANFGRWWRTGKPRMLQSMGSQRVRHDSATTTTATVKPRNWAVCVACVIAQSYLTLCNPLDCSLPGFCVHGILQARLLECVAITFSRDLPNPGFEPGSPTLQADSLPTEPPGRSQIGLSMLKLLSELLLKLWGGGGTERDADGRVSIGWCFI